MEIRKEDEDSLVPETSLRALVEQDIKLSSESRKEEPPISMLEYLDKLEKNPELAQLAHQRMYSMVQSHGYEEISVDTDPRRARILGLEPGFVMRIPKLFQDFKGLEDVVFYIDCYLYMASCQGEASRQMIYFWGPPSSGKSTIAEILRRSLEGLGFWQLKDCAHHDNPINATPRHIRKEIYEKYHIYIDPRADICPQCRKKLIGFKNDYTKFEVEWKTFSQRKGRGIAVVSEVDPINFNMAVLIGEEDISKLGDCPRGDPDTFVLNGAFNKGQRGLTEFVEIWKNPIEAQRPIITLTQEKYVPGPRFSGQLYADTVLIGHSNETEWRKFKSDTSNEALMNRIYILRVPYNLRLTEEVQIYRDSFLGKSTGFRNIHIDPHALEQVAMFALFTRIKPHDKVNLLTKIKILDGQIIVEGGERIDLSLEELRKTADFKEGTVGLSYRDAAKNIAEKSIAHYRCFWENDAQLKAMGGYINAVWIRNLLVKYVTELDIPDEAAWPRPSRQRWLKFIQSDLEEEFKRSIETDLVNAHLAGSGDSLEKKIKILFNVYINHAIACISGDTELDRRFLHSVEEHLVMMALEKGAFRNEIAKAAFALKTDGKEIGPELSAPLAFAIEKRLRKRLIEDIMKIEGDETKRTKLFKALMDLGYAELGAKIMYDYALTHLGRG